MVWKAGYIVFDAFDWDEGNIPKISSRMPVEEAEAFFGLELIVKPDWREDWGEERFCAMGVRGDARCLFATFTYRQYGFLNLLRVISIRFVHSKEREEYEKYKKSVKGE